MAAMSAKQPMTRMVSATLSPLAAEEESAEEKPMTPAAQLQHGRLKAQAGAGAWLIEQGRELFALADCGVFVRMLDDVVADRKQLINFLDGEIIGSIR